VRAELSFAESATAKAAGLTACTSGLPCAKPTEYGDIETIATNKRFFVNFIYMVIL
jgi:hypothetical protein